MRPIHHEKIEAELISEAERDRGIGGFDVIEDADGFNVYDGDHVRAVCATLPEATAEATRLADAFDAARRAAGWSEEAQAGAEACRAGVKWWENPHPAGGPEAYRWDTGHTRERR